MTAPKKHKPIKQEIMKITVEVNLEDGWFDEDQNLDEALKSTIVSQVKQKLWSELKVKAEKEILTQVNTQVNDELESKIQAAVKELIIEDKFKNPNYYSNSDDPARKIEFITLKELTHYKFSSNNSSYSNITDTIKKLSKAFSDEMRNRYDLSFASQLVSKLNEQGLLKQGVFDAITESK